MELVTLCLILSLGARADRQQAKARAGDPDTQFNLGIAYDRGAGVAIDYTKAALSVSLGGPAGLASAQLNLAIAYDLGKRGRQDYSKAALPDRIE
jgi:TPR repeat protein